MKGMKRFGKKGKLSPRYMDPNRILSRVGKVAYDLELPAKLLSMHPIFHVSMLKNYIGDSVVVAPSESLDILTSLSFEEILVEILYHQIRRLRNKEVPLVKVLWRNQSVEGATWEAEADIQSKFQHLFSASADQADGTILP